MESSEDLELFHYGVKGMKWGVRKSETPRPPGISKKQMKNYETIEKNRKLYEAGKLKVTSAQSKRYTRGMMIVGGGSANKARAHTFAGLVVTSGFLLGVREVSNRTMDVSPNIAKNRDIALGIMGGKDALSRVSDLAGINAFAKQQTQLNDHQIVRKALKDQK